MQIRDLSIAYAILAHMALKQALTILGNLNLGMQDPLGEQEYQSRLNQAI